MICWWSLKRKFFVDSSLGAQASKLLLRMRRRTQRTLREYFRIGFSLNANPAEGLCLHLAVPFGFMPPNRQSNHFHDQRRRDALVNEEYLISNAICSACSSNVDLFYGDQYSSWCGIIDAHPCDPVVVFWSSSCRFIHKNRKKPFRSQARSNLIALWRFRSFDIKHE